MASLHLAIPLLPGPTRKSTIRCSGEQRQALFNRIAPVYDNVRTTSAAALKRISIHYSNCHFLCLLCAHFHVCS